MNYFSKNKKWMAYLILLTFLFTCVMPSNLGSMNSMAMAEVETDGTVAGQIEAQPRESSMDNWKNSSGWEMPSNDTRVQYRKTITAGANENEFTVHLEVKTTQDMQELSTSNKSAVVLVLDTSSSMNNTMYNNMKIAAKTFLDSYSKDATAENKRLAAVVTFDLNAKTVQSTNQLSTNTRIWFDLANTAEKEKLIGTKTGNSYAAGGTSLIGALNNKGNGTNMDGGLTLAKNLINSSDVLQGIDDVNIVLLSDGAPNTYAKSSDREKTDQIGYAKSPSSTSGTPEGREYAKTAADNLKAITGKNITIYTIAFNVDETVKSWLASNIATSSATAYDADEVDKLTNVFQSVSKIIQTGAQAWRVIDPMGVNINFDETKQEKTNNVVTNTNKNYYGVTGSNNVESLVWELRLSNVTDSDTTGTQTVYYYHMSYPICLNNTAEGFQFNKAVLTNGTTELKYFFLEDAREELEDATDIESLDLLQTTTFTVPAVEGYKGDLTFKKVDEDDNSKMLPGATFKLKLACNNHSHNGVYAEGVTAKSNEKGIITFNDIPSGHYYTLYETTAPAGYEAIPADTPKVVGTYYVDFRTVKENDKTGDAISSNNKNNVITNKALTGSIEFTKTDGTKPLAGATFGLYASEADATANTNAVQTVVSAANGKVTFANLTPGTYYVKETSAPNEKYVQDTTVYKAVVTAGNTVGLQMLNGEGVTGVVNAPETTSVTVTKVWNDANNQDGIRPTSITVNLLADREVVDTITMTTGGVTILGATFFDATWDDSDLTYTWGNLPKYKTNQDGSLGDEIVYSVDEPTVPTGYKKAIAGDAATGFTITNTHAVNKTSVSVTKAWNDDNNRDNLRPGSIQVQLKADNVALGDPVTLNEANEWTYTWTGLDVNAAGAVGDAIEYTVDEPTVPSGYTSAITGDVATGFTITNTHTPATTEVAGTKIWQDNNNEVGKRPDAIVVRLYADGEEISSVTVSEDTDWAYSFDGLPKYKANAVGQLITYEVKEDAVAGYTSAKKGNNFTNTLEQNWFAISGEKSWKDETGATVAAGAETVVIDLFRDGELYRTTETSADFNWEYSFGDIPRYAVTDKRNEEVIEPATEGYAHKYDYRLVERPVDGYVPSYDVTTEKDGSVVINVINTIGVAVTTVDISGTKSWVAPEGTVLPEKVELTLFAQHGDSEATSVSAITITAADDWKYSFKDLPKYTTGSAIELITYTVEETPIAGYISNIIPTANGFDIVNTLFTKELGQLSVQKQVSGDGAPSADTEYNFVLQMKATQDMSEWDKTLEAKEQELLDAYNEAKAANGKANADLVTAEGKFMDSAFLTTTSSSYEFIMVDGNGYAKLAAERVATPSHYIYEFNGSNTFKPDANGTDESLITSVLDRIKSLFVEEDGYLYDETVLLTLEDEYEVTSPSALVFSMKHMNDVLDAYERVLFTEKLMETTSGSYLQFVEQELTTPTSLTLIVKDIDGKVVDTVEFDVNEALTDTNNFRYEFTLKHNQQLFFTMVATTGSQIVYNIVETSYTPEKLPLNSHECYQYTDIISMENGKETGTLEKVTTTGEYRDLTTGSVYGFVFCNVYDKEDTPPPGGGDYTPEPPKKPEPPKPPEEIIDDPEVPLDAPEVPEEPVVVPGEEIPEPEVPLGDAPATGDAANAVPFMVLMMFALCGLVVIRRKFN